jgi:hypothetical protein
VSDALAELVAAEAGGSRISRGAGREMSSPAAPTNLAVESVVTSAQARPVAPPARAASQRCCRRPAGAVDE